MFRRSAEVAAVQISELSCRPDVWRFEHAIASVYCLWTLKEEETGSWAYAEQLAETNTGQCGRTVISFDESYTNTTCVWYYG
jgi:hypothetical protein